MGNIDINQGDYDKRTALHLAAGEGHLDVVQYLCTAGANVNVADRWNNRPLDDAQSHGFINCVEMLQKFGAKYGSTEPSALGREALIDLFDQYSRKRNGIRDSFGVEMSNVQSLDWHDGAEGVGQKSHGGRA